MDLGKMTDEQLIELLREGKTEITDYLMEKYKDMVRKQARAMYLWGGENDDLIQEDILDGVCGYRELESWVLTYLALKDLERAARIAVVSKASVDIEEQEQIMKIYIQPYLETGGNG